jgi:hypothetical protein
MLTPAEPAEAYARNVNIIDRQAAGLTHADSLLQPPFRGNCLNWVLGHVANNRDVILKALGQPPVFGPAGERYARESDPITCDGPGVLALEELLRVLHAAQDALNAALPGLTEEQLACEVPFARRTVKLDWLLFFLYFHDSYHTGQAELLGQLAGKDDKVI